MRRTLRKIRKDLKRLFDIQCEGKYYGTSLNDYLKHLREFTKTFTEGHSLNSSEELEVEHLIGSIINAKRMKKCKRYLGELQREGVLCPGQRANELKVLFKSFSLKKLQGMLSCSAFKVML